MVQQASKVHRDVHECIPVRAGTRRHDLVFRACVTGMKRQLMHLGATYLFSKRHERLHNTRGRGGDVIHEKRAMRLVVDTRRDGKTVLFHWTQTRLKQNALDQAPHLAQPTK